MGPVVAGMKLGKTPLAPAEAALLATVVGAPAAAEVLVVFADEVVGAADVPVAADGGVAGAAAPHASSSGSAPAASNATPAVRSASRRVSIGSGSPGQRPI